MEANEISIAAAISVLGVSPGKRVWRTAIVLLPSVRKTSALNPPVWTGFRTAQKLTLIAVENAIHAWRAWAAYNYVIAAAVSVRSKSVSKRPAKTACKTAMKQT